MPAPGPQTSYRRLATRAISVLVALSTLVFVVGSAAPRHVHAPTTAGLYNAECPLAELGARQCLVSLPSAPPSIWTGLVPTGTLLVAAANFSASAVLSADSRAPPLA
jgi:hypothetical protein